MADEEEIAIKVTAEGTAEAAKGIDTVTTALEKQRKTEAMINDTSNQIKARNRIQALKDEAKEANNVSAAFRTITQNATPANDVLEKVGFQFGNIRSSAGAASALVGNLGRSFVTMVPQAGSFVSGLQSAGMAMSQFLGLVGGGPGIILGGVVAAVALMANAFAKSSEEAAKLAEETKKNAEELKEYLKTIGDLRQTVADRFGAAQASKEYETNFQAGNLTSQQYAAERQAAKELYAKRDEIGKKRTAAYMSGDKKSLDSLDPLYMQATNAPARGEQARVFEQQARAREAEAKKNADALRMMGHAAEGADADKESLETNKATAAKEAAARADRVKQWQATQDKIAELQKSSREREANLESIQASQDLAAKFKTIDDIAQAQKKASDAEMVAYRKKVAEQTKLDNEHAMAMQQRNKAFSDAATNVAQIGANTTIKMFSDLAKGHKLAIGAVLEGIGDQMVAEGTRVLFQAAAFAFIPGLQAVAPGLAAVGGAEIAAGIGLGAAGARGEGGSNSGGGGGAAAKPTNYADPFGNTARYGPNPNAGPTVININMPTVLSPSAEDGLRIQRALEAKARVYGR